MKLTKKQYIELFGEDPVDMWGSDWENIIDEKTDSWIKNGKREEDE